MSINRTTSGIILPPGCKPPGKVNGKVVKLPSPKANGKTPKPKDARRLCEKFAADGVVVFVFKNNQIGAVAHGSNPTAEKVAHNIAAKMVDMISKGLHNRYENEIKALKARIKELGG